MMCEGFRFITKIDLTRGSLRHSCKTPSPTIPEDPVIMTFIFLFSIIRRWPLSYSICRQATWPWSLADATLIFKPKIQTLDLLLVIGRDQMRDFLIRGGYQDRFSMSECIETPLPVVIADPGTADPAKRHCFYVQRDIDLIDRPTAKGDRIYQIVGVFL